MSIAHNPVSDKVSKLFLNVSRPLPPSIDSGLHYLVNGEVRTWAGETIEVLSPLSSVPLGRAAWLSTEAALECLDAAEKAYDQGRGLWPTMRVSKRIECVQKFVTRMRSVRAECVELLMWEIGKVLGDCEKEFDRTVQYIEDTIEALKELDRAGGRFSTNDSVLAQIRRSPLGVVLCMGPFNYPLNETFTTLIPALISGNTIVAKFPRFGFLCQAPLLKCFAECFPPGVVNVFNGDGAATVGPMMKSGKVASLAFIGSSTVAEILKKQHPALHRCRCVLGLDAKNPAIVLPDANVDLAVRECLSGALSFNGQRCTAIKIIFVHRTIAEDFVTRLGQVVDQLPFGMPWEPGVKLTPLPEPGKPERLQAWVDDAIQKGARVVNRYGGLTERSFYFPSVVYPVNRTMALYSVEQFGPVVPVAVFEDVQEIFDYIAASKYGQQASLFGSDPARIGGLIDALANQVCRINLNSQCQRGPDVYPFTGRKDSAEGTLSVSDALRCFSIRSMVAAPENQINKDLLGKILAERSSNFVNTDFIF